MTIWDNSRLRARPIRTGVPKKSISLWVLLFCRWDLKIITPPVAYTIADYNDDHSVRGIDSLIFHFIDVGKRVSWPEPWFLNRDPRWYFRWPYRLVCVYCLIKESRYWRRDWKIRLARYLLNQNNGLNRNVKHGCLVIAVHGKNRSSFYGKNTLQIRSALFFALPSFTLLFESVINFNVQN